MINIITPNWTVPTQIKACTTTRRANDDMPGFSTNQFAYFNLGINAGDDKDTVQKNREYLQQQLQLPSEPLWLKQIHSNIVVDAKHSTTLNADGSYTQQKNTVCVILTADCLPILLCNKQGTEIAALHGGWRGLANNVIEQGIKKFISKSEDIFAWLGPTIGPNAFEVGQDVYDVFVSEDSSTKKAFKSVSKNHYLANIFELARIRLFHCGVTNVFSCDLCTFSNPKQFYSYRRDGQTGRMASLIWIAYIDKDSINRVSTNMAKKITVLKRQFNGVRSKKLAYFSR